MQANDVPGRGGARHPAVVAGVVLLLAAVGWARWERPAWLATDIPRPAYSVLESEVETARGGCSFNLLVEGSEAEVVESYGRLLREGGWEEGLDDAGRPRFMLERRTLRITVRPPLIEEPRWSRLRVVATRCRGAR